MPVLSAPLDYADPSAKTFLESVQGNILKGHGRDHTAHLFVTFRDPAKGRAWLGELARTTVTSAAQQNEQKAIWRARGGAGMLFATVHLSMTGYMALGIEDQAPADEFFRAGLKRHNSVLRDGRPRHPINDPPPEAWEPGFRSDVHAMLLLADGVRSRLDKRVSESLAQLEVYDAAAFVERGDKLRFDFGKPRGSLEIEHFGHQDGISNPLMTVDDIQKEYRERGRAHWDPAAPLGLAFIEERGGGHGSFMVFRKLEQNVQAFNVARRDLAQTLAVTPDVASALIVGRHRDGTPLIATVTPDPHADPNDFDYSQDRPAGNAPARLCPLHSHIRRSNPRGDIRHYLGAPDDQFERSMRIVRRAITYGARPDLDGAHGEAPTKGVGLLFMSFQADLNQFGIQQAGTDSEDFPFAGAGLEGLTGRAESGMPQPQSWPFSDPNNSSAVRPHSIMGFVTMRGGEYFYAPSLLSLRALAP